MAANLTLVLLFSLPATGAQKPFGHQQAHIPANRIPRTPCATPIRSITRWRRRNRRYLAVRYVEPQQASSAVAPKSTSSTGSGAKASNASNSSSKTSAHTSTASSKSKKSSKKSKHARREPTQKAPTPERISEIQSSLARGGYYQGEPNGKWDANTVGALQKFQSANGLDASGKLDATSLQKLGLGSGIAGVSAPKPPCCSMSPASGNAPSAPSSPAAPPNRQLHPQLQAPSPAAINSHVELDVELHIVRLRRQYFQRVQRSTRPTPAPH